MDEYNPHYFTPEEQHDYEEHESVFNGCENCRIGNKYVDGLCWRCWKDEQILKGKA